MYQNIEAKTGQHSIPRNELFKGTIVGISRNPPIKNDLSDSQWYPLNN